MEKLQLSKKEAKTYLLLKQGLLGKRRFSGKEGAFEFIRQAGCIQFDPIDICGRNPELVLFSRVEGFRKEMLYELLYEDRRLIDYYDKKLSIFSVSDWPCFSRNRNYYRENGRAKDRIDEMEKGMLDALRVMGTATAKELDNGENILWYWGSSTKMAIAALETLFGRGQVVIHHKKGVNKVYCLPEAVLDRDILISPDPNTGEEDYIQWHLKRRIASVGLLWNRPSDALMDIMGLNAEKRDRAFRSLLEKGELIALEVEGIKETLYCLSEDLPYLLDAESGKAFLKRAELLAPLDNMLWDRKLVQALFDFDYKWEIYTPREKRKYGHYTLPLLYGTDFLGRAEIVRDRERNTLIVKRFWPEDKKRMTKQGEKSILSLLKRFSSFHQCGEIENLILP